jgi:hypothetical protein
MQTKRIFTQSPRRLKLEQGEWRLRSIHAFGTGVPGERWDSRNNLPSAGRGCHDPRLALHPDDSGIDILWRVAALLVIGDEVVEQMEHVCGKGGDLVGAECRLINVADDRSQYTERGPVLQRAGRPIDAVQHSGKWLAYFVIEASAEVSRPTATEFGHESCETLLDG